MAPLPRLALKKNQDRRVRGGHPWIFSNEVAGVEGAEDGGLVEVYDSRGAFLGRAYYNRRSLICARLLTRGRDEIDLDFFVKRLERALQYRRAVVPDAEALRLVHSESDQLPGLVIDRYGEWLAVQVLTLGMEARSDLVRQAIERVLSPRGVVRIADSPLRKLEGLPLERGLWWGDVPEHAEISLGGFRVEVDLLHGQKTGLFLDQRENRRLAESHAAGRRVLDLFCYQGEWALHAARGGAEEVLAVDSSAPALAAARRNAERNQLADRVSFVEGDVFDTVRSLERQGERFGLVILDPPALIKSRSHIAAGARAYRELNRAAMAMLNEGDVLITCSCSHQLEDPLFEQVLREAARAARRPFRVLDWRGEALDHPRLLAVAETHYLKCAVLQAV
ncbi:MAG TPA: class I SAM-dependent rRNA methyltransferase [Candidatus Eisenbacteria bacterium]|nr:class I SAM-dependent rRNA methyltransferase [Candidatus Eisenbacteria bacterium]